MYISKIANIVCVLNQFSETKCTPNEFSKFADTQCPHFSLVKTCNNPHAY